MTIRSKKLCRCLSRSKGRNNVKSSASPDLAPLVSVRQEQFQDVKPYRNPPSSERTDHSTEPWTDEVEPSSITAEKVSPRDVAIAQLQDSNFRASNSCQGPPNTFTFKRDLASALHLRIRSISRAYLHRKRYNSTRNSHSVFRWEYGNSSLFQVRYFISESPQRLQFSES